MRWPGFLTRDPAARRGEAARDPAVAEAPIEATPVAEDDAPFLQRWSRRKLAVPQHLPAALPDLAPDSGEPPGAPLEPAPLPELPALDTITAETDITGFLAKGVTLAVRNAALRKMWSLDPAIRDYVGDARDYAYDWNTPGGVPGFGAIDPAYDVEGTLARMFSDPEQAKREMAAAESERMPGLPPEANDAVRRSGADEPDEEARPEAGGEPGPAPAGTDNEVVSEAGPAAAETPQEPGLEPENGPESPSAKAQLADGGPDAGRGDPLSRGIATPRHGKATPA